MKKTALLSIAYTSIMFRLAILILTTFILTLSFASSTHAAVMTAPAAQWTAQTPAEANTWRSVAYGNGSYVAVSSDGSNRVMTSPDGITWTTRTAAEANWWNAVTYGNGQFVAVGLTGTNRVMTSPDGITWTTRT